MFDRLRLSVSLFSLALLGAMACLAQAPVGSLTGTLHDASGAVMPGVAVTVTNQDTGLERKVETSAEGIFSAASLPAGNYRVKAMATGFRTFEQSTIVQTGQVSSLALEMQVGPEVEVINVQADCA